MRIRLDGSDGGLIETEAFWIHMNKDTMMPSRVADEFFAQMATTTDDHRLRWHTWLPEQLANDPSVSFPLRRTDIDHYQHVTNSVYWQGVFEVAAKMPGLTAGRRWLVIEYDKPIKYGEAVRTHTRPDCDSLHIWFAVDGDVRARAQVRRQEG